MIEPAGKVGGVEQAERRRRQAFVFLSPFGRVLDQLRGVPFGEEDFMAFRLQPLVQQQQLRALARPIDALDDDQFPGIGMGRRGGVEGAVRSCRILLRF